MPASEPRLDLLSIIRDGIDKLPGDDHPGLKAVVNHIEVAIRHLQTGQKTGDNQLFTDAVYRCNQAFEGSVKELYRVIAGKDPSKTTPQKIETILEGANILRPKVINQLKRYRQEWRNPSTHDYTLDFDEDEAFLAIVNIAAFAQTAVSQIASKLAFDAASKTKLKPKRTKTSVSVKASDEYPLNEAVAIYSGVYLSNADFSETGGGRIPEGQIASMLAGFLSSIDGAEVEVESQLSSSHRVYADVLVKRGKERSIIEVRTSKAMGYYTPRGLEQLKSYMELGNISNGVLVIYDTKEKHYSMLTAPPATEGNIHVILPKGMVALTEDRWREFGRYDIS